MYKKFGFALNSSSFTCFMFLPVNYLSHLFPIMTEQPYDSIPNFSAADAFRLTGIGRNEFIDIMNKCRSKVLDYVGCVFI